ncbi:MAG: histidinol-phosphate transaminase [Gammaproteobacteria bacterium]
MTYQRPNIEKMQGYSPGEQLNDPAVIKLNTNENPYPVSEKAQAALRNLDAASLRRYPPPLADDFRRAAAQLHGISPDNIMATNGGDELLRLILTTYVDSNETVAVTRPSYSLYPVLVDVQGCKLHEIDLQEDWSMPADFAQQLQQANAKLCILVNPHAPSGKLLSQDYLSELAAAFSGILLVDEAYVDFIAPEQNYQSVPLIDKHENVLILRTMSKGYSLAGLRFGYGLGAESLIAPMLYKTRDSYNTDLIAQKLALAAITDQDYAQSTWERVRQSRNSLTEQLNSLGFTVLPSHANFVLAQVPDKMDAKALQLALKERKILIRYFEQDRLRDKLRISIGTDAENDRLLEALHELLA